jgi:hypothetical protein
MRPFDGVLVEPVGLGGVPSTTGKTARNLGGSEV